MRKKTFKNYYIHLFFILLIFNFAVDYFIPLDDPIGVIVGRLTWTSVIFAVWFTVFGYCFDRLFSIHMKSTMFKYEQLEGMDDKTFLRIEIYFEDPEDLGLNDRIRGKYIANVSYGIFGVAWGKPKAELSLIRKMQKDLKEGNV